MPPLALLVLNLSAVDPLMSSFVSGSWCQAGRKRGICHLPGMQVLLLHFALIYSLFYHYFVSDSRCATSGPCRGQDLVSVNGHV